jgi:hypothetical protein
VPAPFDLLPFRELEDRLLRGGIAPRHVRRYLRELSEHLADLTAAQREAGFNIDDASARARAALGPDIELTDAMLKQRDFRSLAARFPWAVFGLAPVFLALLAFILTALLIVATAWLGRLLDANGELATAPVWFQTASQVVAQMATFLWPPLIASLLVTLAARQRMSLYWPLLGIAMIVTCGLHMSAMVVPPGQRGFSIGLGPTMLPLPRALGGNSFHFEGLIILAQGTMALLPLAWLLRTRRRVEQEHV